MSKKIIAGALGTATLLGSLAMLGGSTFAATTGWHQVSVTPSSEFVLGGTTSTNTILNPSITAIDFVATGALTVKATEAWKISWQAVTGSNTDAATVAATGTNLGTAGFTATGGYAYAGATATVGANSWGASLAGANGATIAGSYTLGTSLSTIVTGGATSTATVTPTYSAGTDGSLGTNTYSGTIYYTLTTGV